ncbi:TetR family transcriptional regulator [Amycolatopsis mediterranei S699]|uniref:TetR family transcriptional regulator n=2 Tax=Amycolatopsis mediterranei TaxID=33910 RepID=A0A0H3DBP7_AMYMU|nr:TetR family transcriptional regulator [Amycolatopsis mediterranei U32]AEK44982.1 TetR family transcriptional regulator [Amycolatopsis mediterranei S699]AGT86920.1 TetR family transcriptional regulator [Amycolatopsis mediterranei RB]KDO10566.1 TetR family transcriptional regulator [Amycolatopsis mediterranei]AFO79792.1 TetR family transcriptional regulator [Amycolatopsis mediterranei S699]
MQIAEALQRLTTRAGLEGVSLRQVAAEAGMSMGSVQHYFTRVDPGITRVDRSRTRRSCAKGRHA